MSRAPHAPSKETYPPTDPPSDYILNPLDTSNPAPLYPLHYEPGSVILTIYFHSHLNDFTAIVVHPANMHNNTIISSK
jgi:hypothetical protein